MEGSSKSKFLIRLIVIAAVLGILSVGLAQKVVVVTTTTVITLPGTTKTTVIKKPGTTGVVTVVHGGYKFVYAEMKPDQECVIVVEGEPKAVMTMPGVSFPGVTTTYTIPATVYETTITRVEGGSTITTTGMDLVTVETTVKMGPVTTVIVMPIPIYGTIKEYCKRITVTIINRFEASEPATIVLKLPGTTYKGTVVTMPPLPFTGRVTATKTITKPGATYTTTMEEAGVTSVKTVKEPGTTITKTITVPGKTITKKTVYTTTLSETSKPAKPTKPPKPTKTKPPKPPKPHETVTSETTTAAAAFGGLTTTMLVIAAIAIAAVVAVIVAFLVRRPRSPGT